MTRLFFLVLSLFFAVPAMADPSTTELYEARIACRDSFLTRDAEAYVNASATMTNWGEIENEDTAREVELCLSLAAAFDETELQEARNRASESTDLEEASERVTPEFSDDTRLEGYLARAQATDVDFAALATDIATDEDFVAPPGAERDALEVALNEYVAPIPASRAQQNLTAYQALARLNPGVQRYRDRVLRYEGAIDAERERLANTAQQLEDRLVRTVAEFDGSSWARHPLSPRFQDIRDYITLYLLESASGLQSLQLFVNYTSGDGWLFVDNASINIDGETRRLPVPRWFRDNDTEIWEFGSINGPNALLIARQIADSERAVIRFNGQQFYSDYVVSETDKRVIREMLAMWKVISVD